MVKTLNSEQGRIYVANKYPTFSRTIMIISQKQRILSRITLKRGQNQFVLMKNMQILG